MLLKGEVVREKLIPLLEVQRETEPILELNAKVRYNEAWRKLMRSMEPVPPSAYFDDTFDNMTDEQFNEAYEYLKSRIQNNDFEFEFYEKGSPQSIDEWLDKLKKAKGEQ